MCTSDLLSSQIILLCWLENQRMIFSFHMENTLKINWHHHNSKTTKPDSVCVAGHYDTMKVSWRCPAVMMAWKCSRVSFHAPLWPLCAMTGKSLPFTRGFNGVCKVLCSRRSIVLLSISILRIQYSHYDRPPTLSPYWGRFSHQIFLVPLCDSASLGSM